MGFKGCIRELETENKDLREIPVDLMITGNTDPGRVFYRVKKCGCKDLECQNEGTCQERPQDFKCQCKLGYTGPQCQIIGRYDFNFMAGFWWELQKEPCIIGGLQGVGVSWRVYGRGSEN